MSFNWILLGIAVAFIGLHVWTRRGDIGVEEAKELVGAGARLIDVRSPAEFAAGALPGAVNIPVSEIGSRLDGLGPRNKPIVVYCRSGNRSASARRILMGAGFTQVRNLGAMSRWG